MAVQASMCSAAHLLHFCRRGSEQFDVSRADQLAVLLQCLAGHVLRLEQDEGVAGRSAVSLLDEQHAILAVHDFTRVELSVREEVDLFFGEADATNVAVARQRKTEKQEREEGERERAAVIITK